MAPEGNMACGKMDLPVMSQQSPTLGSSTPPLCPRDIHATHLPKALSGHRRPSPLDGTVGPRQPCPSQSAPHGARPASLASVPRLSHAAPPSLCAWHRFLPPGCLTPAQPRGPSLTPHFSTSGPVWPPRPPASVSCPLSVICPSQGWAPSRGRQGTGLGRGLAAGVLAHPHQAACDSMKLCHFKSLNLWELLQQQLETNGGLWEREKGVGVGSGGEEGRGGEGWGGRRGRRGRRGRGRREKAGREG